MLMFNKEIVYTFTFKHFIKSILNYNHYGINICTFNIFLIFSKPLSTHPVSIKMYSFTTIKLHLNKTATNTFLI